MEKNRKISEATTAMARCHKDSVLIAEKTEQGLWKDIATGEKKMTWKELLEFKCAIWGVGKQYDSDL